MTITKSYPDKSSSNDVYDANGQPIVIEPDDVNPNNTDANYYKNSHVPQPAGTGHYVQNPRYVDIASRVPVVLTYCPKCAQQQVMTHTRTKATGTTWLCVVAGVFIFWPLCWLPLAIRPMKQTNHYCNGCGAKVGRVKPFQ